VYFLYVQKMEQQCPVHQVFAAACPIDQARRRIEALKQVPGLSRIWLTKNGYGTPRTTGNGKTVPSGGLGE
jgi:hypothetical protein